MAKKKHPVIKAYKKIEKYFAKRPIVFALIIGLVSIVPISIFSTQVFGFINQEITLKAYILFLLIVFPFAFYTIVKKKGRFLNKMISELEILEHRLERPFTSQGKQFYPYEILECYSDFYDLLEILEEKYPKEFEEFPFRSSPDVPDGDWIPFESVLPLSMDISVAKLRLKNISN